MKVVAFVDPPQGEAIEKILRHCSLWCSSTPRPPPDVNGLLHELASGQVGELTYVDMDTSLANF